MVVIQATHAAPAASSPETFARTAILAWANQILQCDYRAFTEIPPHDLALILYGVFACEQGDTAASSPSSQATAQPSVSLQNIQFPAHYASSSSSPFTLGGGSPPPAGARGELTRTLHERNAAHVLAAVQNLSRRLSEGAGSGVPLVLSPSTTPSSWIDGKAFVDELRVWRWTRTAALERAATVDRIRAAISAFLHGTATLATSVTPPRTHTDAPAKRARSDDSREEATASPTSQLTSPSPPSKRHAAEPTVAPSLVQASRQRLERAVAGHTNPSYPDITGGTLGGIGEPTGASCSTALPRAPQVIRVEVTDHAVLEAPKLAAEIATKAALLAEAQTVRLQPGTGSTAGEAAAAPAENGAAQALPTIAESPLVVAGIVVPQGACPSCTPVVAQAIQCNLRRIEALEEARQRAIAACLRKDASALLAALSAVV